VIQTLSCPTSRMPSLASLNADGFIHWGLVW
jgi:hypothetical protein